MCFYCVIDIKPGITLLSKIKCPRGRMYVAQKRVVNTIGKHLTESRAKTA